MRYNYCMDKDAIKKAMLAHHIFPNKKGYKYLLAVVEYVYKMRPAKLSDAYDAAALQFGVKPNSIEKSISDAIESSFDNAENAGRYGFLASAESGKITNKRFVAILIKEIHNA